MHIICCISYRRVCVRPHNNLTSSSAVAKRPRDASCLSVVSFNSTKRLVESFIVKLRRLQICHCVQLNALFCCLTVFGVTLRLLVITISSSSPAINTAAYYHRCVTTCETVAVHRRPRLQHLACCSVNTGSKPDIGSESRFLPTPSAFDTPVRGVPVGILLCRLAWKN